MSSYNRPDSQYTFLKLQPLPHLHNPSRALSYLERVKNDPGVRAVMRKHKWTVGVLQEMEPLGNTSIDSKILGRNHNKGMMIELRLRTDDYDGYRPYDMVLATVYHELAHNVYSEHDRKFFDLMNELIKEGERADWTKGGRPLTDQVFYNPPEQPEVKKASGLKGGTFRLGGASSGSAAGSSGAVMNSGSALADEAAKRREMMAKAAEARLMKLGGKSS